MGNFFVLQVHSVLKRHRNTQALNAIFMLEVIRYGFETLLDEGLCSKGNVSVAQLKCQLAYFC